MPFSVRLKGKRVLAGIGIGAGAVGVAVAERVVNDTAADAKVSFSLVGIVSAMWTVLSNNWLAAVGWLGFIAFAFIAIATYLEDRQRTPSPVLPPPELSAGGGGLAQVLKAFARVRVITHATAAATSSPIPGHFKALFRDAGWKLDEGRTELPEDAVGVTVYGPNAMSKSILRWAAATLGYTARIGGRDDSEWQVVIGADPSKTDAAILAGQLAQLKRSESEIQSLKNARDTLETALTEEKRAHAKLKLKELAEKIAKTASTDDKQPSVTVRYINHEDKDIASYIWRLFSRYATGWRVEDLERNSGTKLDDYGRTYVFECGKPEIAKDFGWLFMDGHLLARNEINWYEIPERDDYHLFVTVFPRRTN
jgi:hypothetical protein